jgi:DNA end-binding protein Ku
MTRANKVAVAKVVLRDKEHLATVRVYGDTLVMETLFYPDEIRDSGQLEGLGSKVNEKEVQMAINLIEALSGEFEPDKYKDEYREALLEVINHKIEGTPMEAVPVAKPSPKVMDLFDTLRASVEAAKRPEEAPKGKRKVA